MISILLAAAAAPVAVASPDQSIVISIAPDGKSYSVTRKGEIILRHAGEGAVQRLPRVLDDALAPPKR